MKCPKCHFTSFDHHAECPKCHKELSTEREALGLSAFRPDPPSLLGTTSEEGSLDFGWAPSSLEPPVGSEGHEPEKALLEGEQEVSEPVTDLSWEPSRHMKDPGETEIPRDRERPSRGEASGGEGETDMLASLEESDEKLAFSDVDLDVDVVPLDFDDEIEAWNPDDALGPGSSGNGKSRVR